MSLFDDNDLLRLLLAKKETVSGEFYHLGWVTNVASKGNSLETAMTSLHEGFHNELNNLTPYGFLLQAYAMLIISEKGDAKCKAIIKELVNQSRQAHEIYATFLSTSMLAQKIEYKDKNPLTLLDSYPRYKKYYQLGNQLTHIFQGNYLKEVAVEAIIICCFQRGAVAIWHEKNKKVTRNYHLYSD